MCNGKNVTVQEKRATKKATRQNSFRSLRIRNGETKLVWQVA